MNYVPTSESACHNRLPDDQSPSIFEVCYNLPNHCLPTAERRHTGRRSSEVRLYRFR